MSISGTGKEEVVAAALTLTGGIFVGVGTIPGTSPRFSVATAVRGDLIASIRIPAILSSRTR